MKSEDFSASPFGPKQDAWFLELMYCGDSIACSSSYLLARNVLAFSKSFFGYVHCLVAMLGLLGANAVWRR